MDRYNNLNNTAPEVDPTKQKKPNVDKSDFDLSCAKYFKTIDGAIVPFDVFRVIPNSSYELSYSIRAIMSNPYVKQLLSGKRAYVHVYHSDLPDLWEGATEFIKKGRDFATSLKIPTLAHIIDDGADSSTKYFETLTAGSPACYMGLPVAKYDTNVSPIENIKPIRTDNENSKRRDITDYSNFEFSALPLVMYQQIYQAHYLNKNLVNSNTAWLPQVENHFILPLEASGQSVARLSYDVDTAKDTAVYSSEDFDFNSDYFVPRDVSDSDPTTKSNAPLLNVLRFRQFKGDMFTSGSPFPDLMRGDVPVMSFNDLTGSVDWSKVLSPSVPVFGATSSVGSVDIRTNSSEQLHWLSLVNNGSVVSGTTLEDVLSRAIVKVQGQISWNLNAIRALDVYTLLGERAARTDGTYNDFIKTMFGVDPKMHMHEPRYIGGFYLDFVNSTIEQTSETGTTPLGTVSSRAITNGNGYIGKFSFNNPGYVMAVLDIVDETIYTSGVERDWTDLEFDDQYLPLFNGLAPQFTRQQELVLTGVKADNEDVFNYVERFSHLKSRRNKALGQMSLPAYDSNDNPVDFESCSYIHSRHFTSKLSFNNKFVTMTPKNIDMTPYTSTTDYPFLVTAECRNQAILPLPYVTVPSGLSIMA